LLTRLVECYGWPTQLCTDNGSIFISARLTEWCEKQAIVLHWVQPDKPNQNAYIERFNGSFRRELLDAYLFRAVAYNRAKAWTAPLANQYPAYFLKFRHCSFFKRLIRNFWIEGV
jgi:putative transposase